MGKEKVVLLAGKWDNLGITQGDSWPDLLNVLNLLKSNLKKV
jgi:hypothetical protein